MLERRVSVASKFQDDRYYMVFHAYFDVLAQVHSVVETKNGSWTLRVWRAQKFGPEASKEKREMNLFHVTENTFKCYIVPPDPRIGKAVEESGKEFLIEIDVYDDHRIGIEKLNSGDFVALQNVHAASVGLTEMQVLHGGGQAYNRGISKVPVDFRNEAFQIFKKRVESVLEAVTDCDNFIEFQQKENVVQSETSTQTSSSNTSGDADLKHCQQIKIGEDISVDYFLKKSGSRYNFLTHAHSDHYRGLDKKWTRSVYCSPETAKLLPHIMGYTADSPPPAGLINPLEENVPHKFDSFQVTLVNANHCPGAVMFVFEGSKIEEIAGGAVLCTGDFRADKMFLESLKPGNQLHWMTEIKFGIIYLDNTYFSLDMPFPERCEAEKILLKAIEAHPHENIVIPLHRLGREELIQAISRILNEPIMVYDERKVISDLLDFSSNCGVLKQYRDIKVIKKGSYCEISQNSVIIDISMLYYTFGNGVNDDEGIIRIPYSDHSSRSEILKFLSHFHFKTITPCTKKYSIIELASLENAGKRSEEDHTVEKTQSTIQGTPISQLQEDPLPPGVVFRTNTCDFMDMDLDNWPEGPPKTFAEAIARANNSRRPRNPGL